MAPKKQNGTNDQKSNGNESFMAAFDKPTQIYRFLKTRTNYYPCFMHRNLYYMKGRSNRNNSARKSFDINMLLARKLKEREKKEDRGSQMGKSLMVGFMSYEDIDSDESFDREPKFVKVQTSLEKTFHKRRKEGSTSSNSKDIGNNLNVPIRNTVDSLIPDKIPLLVISPDMLEAEITSSHKLVFRVDLPSHSISSTTDFGEHPSKHGRQESLFADSIVYEKLRSQILDGEYEVVLKDEQEYRPSKKLCTWESIPDEQIPEWCNNNIHMNDAMNEFEKFDGGCKILRVFFKWTKDPPTGGYINRSELTMSDDIDDDKENDEQNNNGKEVCIQKEKAFVFQFNHGNSHKQQLSERENFACPWCNLDCQMMYVLMKHLKLCHPRFCFTYVPDIDHPRVDVTLNDQYDASYSGSPHDLLKTIKDKRPERKTISTYILVFKPKRDLTMNLNDFVEVDENELESQRPYTTGHNRIYFHTETCLPIPAKELDYDSEGEKDPKWLQRKTKQMIDEFSDVNEGEKELMKLWNLHVMKFGFVGDSQVPLATDMFVKLNGEELLRKGLYRNFIIHLTSMFDFGQISPEIMHKNIQKLQKILSEHEDIQKKFIETRRQQHEYWKRSDQKPLPIKKEETPTTPSKNIRKLSTVNFGASTSQGRVSIKSPKVLLEKIKKVEKNSTAIKSASNSSNKRKSTKLDESTRDRNKPKLDKVVAKPENNTKRCITRRDSILLQRKK